MENTDPLAYEFAKKLEGLSRHEARIILEQTQAILDVEFKLLACDKFTEEFIKRSV